MPAQRTSPLLPWVAPTLVVAISWLLTWTGVYLLATVGNAPPAATTLVCWVTTVVLSVDSLLVVGLNHRWTRGIRRALVLGIPGAEADRALHEALRYGLRMTALVIALVIASVAVGATTLALAGHGAVAASMVLAAAVTGPADVAVLAITLDLITVALVRALRQIDPAQRRRGAPTPRRHRRKLTILIGLVTTACVAMAGFAGWVGHHWEVVIAATVGLVAGWIGAALVAGIQSRAILALEDGMRRVGTGDLSTRIEVVAVDDLGRIAEAFDDMVAALAEAQFEILERRGQLERAHRRDALATLASGVSHEARNPLAASQAALDVALEELNQLGRSGSNREEGERLAVIRAAMLDALEGIGRITRVVAALDDEAEAAATEDPQGRTLVDLAEVARSTIKLALGGSLGVELIANCGPVPKVLGRTQDLRQVILDLILNAVDATKRRRGPAASLESVTVATLIKDERVAVAVIDRGNGIDENTYAHLFEPFFTTKTRPAGVGLGLYLARRVIEDHHGAIEVDSVPGQGTTVTISLPACRETGPSKWQGPQSPMMGGPAGKTGDPDLAAVTGGGKRNPPPSLTLGEDRLLPWVHGPGLPTGRPSASVGEGRLRRRWVKVKRLRAAELPRPRALGGRGRGRAETVCCGGPRRGSNRRNPRRNRPQAFGPARRWRNRRPWVARRGPGAGARRPSVGHRGGRARESHRCQGRPGRAA